MKTIVLAAVAALLVGGAAQAATTGSQDQAMKVAQSTVIEVPVGQTLHAAPQVPAENPTGLPAYEMRPDGLMINGLLPAQGWEG